MYKIYWITFLLFGLGSTTTSVLGQNGEHLEAFQVLKDSMTSNLLKMAFPITPSLENANSYLEDEWKDALILTKEGEIYPFLGRFNLLTNLLEMKIGNQLFALNSSAVDAAFIGSHFLVPFQAGDLPDTDQKGFLEILVKGKEPLFCRYHTRWSMEAAGNVLTPTVTGNAKYEVTPVFYYYSPKRDYVIVPLAAKDQFFAIFGNLQDKIQEYIKENRLRRNRQLDLIQVFRFYNRML